MKFDSSSKDITPKSKGSSWAAIAINVLTAVILLLAKNVIPIANPSYCTHKILENKLNVILIKNDDYLIIFFIYKKFNISTGF